MPTPGSPNVGAHNERNKRHRVIRTNMVLYGDRPPIHRQIGVIFAGFTVMMIITGISLSLATLFGSRLLRQGASLALGTWQFNIQSALWCFTSLFVEPLALKMTHRMVTILGCTLCTLALFLSAPLFDPVMLFFSVSILYGIGGGLCTACCYQMNNRYFSQYLGLANGTILIGSTLGIAIISTISDVAQKHLGFTWATTIIGLLPVIAAMTASLYRPLDAPPREVPLGRNRTGAQEESGESTGERTPYKHALAFVSGGSTILGMAMSRKVDGQTLKEDEKKTMWNFFKENYRWSVVRDGKVLGYAFINSISMVALLNIYTGASYMLRDAGYTRTDGVYFLWVTESLDLVARIVCSFVCDLPYVNKGVGLQFIYGCAQFIFMVIPIVMTLMRGTWWIVLACASFYGIGMGTLYVLDVLLLARCVSEDKFQSAYAMSLFIRSVAFLVIGPLGGAIRETTGDYQGVFFFHCACMVVAFILLVFMATKNTPFFRHA